ncbi:MAG: YfcE family phosphodiesterase [Bacilli bacterium]|nr:YfcE family phosphodiesterase [Bacilli bacterium]
MKYLVVSDLHGVKAYLSEFEKIVKLELPDKIVLLGDILSNTSDDYLISETLNLYKDKIIGIRGNNDTYYVEKLLDFKLNDYYIERINNKNFFFTHGHLLYSFDFDNIDYIISGHTHISGVKEYMNIPIINPGSISLPRDFKHTYMIISDKIYIKDIDGNILEEVSI